MTFNPCYLILSDLVERQSAVLFFLYFGPGRGHNISPSNFVVDFFLGNHLVQQEVISSLINMQIYNIFKKNQNIALLKAHSSKHN